MIAVVLCFIVWPYLISQILHADNLAIVNGTICGLIELFL